MNVTPTAGNPKESLPPTQTRRKRGDHRPPDARREPDPVTTTVEPDPVPAVEPVKPNPFEPSTLPPKEPSHNGHGTRAVEPAPVSTGDSDDGIEYCDAVPGRYVADVMCPTLEMSVKRALNQAKSYVCVDDLLALKLIKVGERPVYTKVNGWCLTTLKKEFNLGATVMARDELQAIVTVGTDRTREVALATLQGVDAEGAAWATAAMTKLRERNTLRGGDNRAKPPLTLTVGDLIALGADKSDVAVLPTANDSLRAASMKIIKSWDENDRTEARMPAASVRGVVLTPFTEIFSDAPTWVWKYGGYGRIMRGTLSIWGGRPGAGKSTAARWFCSEATRGTLEGCFFGKPQTVAYIGSEESFKYMVKPSLQAHGAEMSRVMHVKTFSDGRDCRLLAAEDEVALTAQLLAHGVTVVVVDPLMSTVDAKTDTHRNNETREVLEPWARIAEEINGVVVGITHLTKDTSNGDILAKLQGSSAFGEVPRSVFGLVKGADGTRVMSQVKNSAGRDDLNLVYEVVETEVTPDSGMTTTVTRFEIIGESEVTASEVLQEQAGGRGGSGGRVQTELAMWLGKFMAGGPCWATDGYKAAETAGYTEDQVKKNRKACGVESKRAPGGDGRWYWATGEQLAAGELPHDIDDVGGVVMG